MKIEKLVIYGFGKHENVTIELGSGMTVLYGQNESGKTTIQQFILHILFGFPQRNHARLRYEPKSGGKYGGQIHLEDAVYGKCIVERVRGKSAGDVTVYFEDGRVGEQAALDKLLRQYDRAAFESVFAFSLLQLQGFEKMTEQELSRTLLASGTTGVDHLVQIEATLNKELDLLFKQRGRNPVLNQKLADLQQLEETLREEMQKADQYTPAVERLQEIEESLQRTYEQQAVNEARLRELTSERQRLPLEQRRALLQERLAQLKAVHFPTEGIQRYTAALTKREEAQAAVVRIQEEIEAVEQDLVVTADVTGLSKMKQLLEQESTWHRSLSTLETLQATREQLVDRENRLRARLGIQAGQEQTTLLTADVSIRQEEALYELLEGLQHNHRALDAIENEQAQTEASFKRLIDRETYRRQPTTEARARVKQWPEIQAQATEAKVYLRMQQTQQKTVQMLALIGGAILILLIVYGVISQQYGLAFIAGLGAVAGGVFMRKQLTNHKDEVMIERIQLYENQEQEMLEMIEQVALYDREQVTHEKEKSSLAIKRQQLAERYDVIEQLVDELEQELQVFLAQYGIDGLPSAPIIPELFRMVREIQESMQQFEELTADIEALEEKIQQQHAACEVLLNEEIPRASLYEWIRREYKIVSAQVEVQERAHKNKQELMRALQEKEALVTLLQAQIDRLFEEAAVRSEEAYYEADQMMQEKKRLVQQIADLTAQLNGQEAVDLSLTDAQLENMMEEINEQRRITRERQEALVEEKAILYNKTRALVTDDAMSVLQQRLEIERAQFTELAKKWAAKKTVVAAIEQLMNDLKEKQFPAVLQEATALFTRLTSGRYESMVLTEAGHFEVLSTAGMRFPIIELSQATKEQAYLSLRLALAISLVETAPFPIIMDDPFVHFDAERLGNMRYVLEKLTTHQFIYFTCHEEMKDYWQQATTINVSTIGNN